MNYSPLLKTNTVIAHIYSAVKGNIPNILKNSLQEPLLPGPIIILIIFFCNLKTSILHEEFPQNNSHY